jgi:tetratricopeptide (TPR) repeat protein
MTINNLGNLYYSMRDYAKAEHFFQRALKVREKALGPDHPDTALALNNLALLYIARGEHAKVGRLSWSACLQSHARLRQSRTALSARAQD